MSVPDDTAAVLAMGPPSPPGRSTALRQRARCDNVTVTAADGRVFDLGSPDSLWFRVRVMKYRVKRRRSHG